MSKYGKPYPTTPALPVTVRPGVVVSGGARTAYGTLGVIINRGRNMNLPRFPGHEHVVSEGKVYHLPTFRGETPWHHLLNTASSRKGTAHAATAIFEKARKVGALIKGCRGCTRQSCVMKKLHSAAAPAETAAETDGQPDAALAQHRIEDADGAASKGDADSKFASPLGDHEGEGAVDPILPNRCRTQGQWRAEMAQFAVRRIDGFQPACGTAPLLVVVELRNCSLEGTGAGTKGGHLKGMLQLSVPKSERWLNCRRGL